MGYKKICFFLVVCVITLSLLGCGKKESALINQKVSACHSREVIYEKKRTAEEWDRIIFAMKQRGLELTPVEEKEIMDFLHKHYTEKH